MREVGPYKTQTVNPLSQCGCRAYMVQMPVGERFSGRRMKQRSSDSFIYLFF